MAISERTKTTPGQSTINESDDLYPHPSPLGDNPWEGETIRRFGDDVSTTTKDISALAQWKHGQKIRGTFAKSQEGMMSEINDINKAWGKQKQRKDVYIDTFLPDIGKRLKDGDQ